MYRLFLSFTLLCSTLSALHIGDRYDFICSDGQDIINAELIAEDSERYFVKLSTSVTNVEIEKKFVIRTVDQPHPTEISPKTFRFAVDGGVSFATGRLADYAPLGPGLGVSVEYGDWHSLVALARIAAQQFSSGDSYLRIFTSVFGIGWRRTWLWQIQSTAGLGAGSALVAATRTGYNQTSSTLVVAIWTEIRRPVTTRVDAGIAAQVTYVYDRYTTTIMPGISATVSYRW